MPDTRLEKILFKCRMEGNEVLSLMQSYIDKYGNVTVGELYKMLGKTSDFKNNTYGWTNLKTAMVVGTMEGYELKLPPPIELIHPTEPQLELDIPPLTITLPNTDTGNQAYINKIGTTINIFGGFKKVISVKFTVDNIIMELR
jgi:hypothetical protein